MKLLFLRDKNAKKKWEALESEYTSQQMRIFRHIAKHGLEGVVTVPSTEAADTPPEVLDKIPIP